MRADSCECVFKMRLLSQNCLLPSMPLLDLSGVAIMLNRRWRSSQKAATKQ